jgi:hypothetical protein
MNFGMTFSTNRNYRKAMLKRIAEMMMIMLCCSLVAFNTDVCFNWNQITTSNSMAYCCSTFPFFFVISVILSIEFFRFFRLSPLLLVTVCLGCLVVFFTGYQVASLTTAKKTILLCSWVFVKFRHRFDLLALRTLFCYNRFSHVRSSITGLVKAAVGLQPVCSLFYDTLYGRYVNV